MATICSNVPGVVGSSGNLSQLKTMSSLEKFSSWVQRVHIFCTLVCFELVIDLDILAAVDARRHVATELLRIWADIAVMCDARSGTAHIDHLETRKQWTMVAYGSETMISRFWLRVTEMQGTRLSRGSRRRAPLRPKWLGEFRDSCPQHVSFQWRAL